VLAALGRPQAQHRPRPRRDRTRPQPQPGGTRVTAPAPAGRSRSARRFRTGQQNVRSLSSADEAPRARPVGAGADAPVSVLGACGSVWRSVRRHRALSPGQSMPNGLALERATKASSQAGADSAEERHVGLVEALGSAAPYCELPVGRHARRCAAAPANNPRPTKARACADTHERVGLGTRCLVRKARAPARSGRRWEDHL
jgi:hypothetical protein